MNKSCKYIIGITFLVLGVLWFLGSIGTLAFNILFKGWWALFIIVPSVCALFSSRNRISGLFGLGIGIILLLCAQGVLDWDIIWKLLLALLFVIIGIKLIFGRDDHKMLDMKSSKAEGKTDFDINFSKQSYNFDEEYFNGARIKIAFGSLCLDLRKAKIEKDCIIDCECCFAGMEILLPSNVKVECNTKATFGGVENKFINFSVENKPCVLIRGEVTFAGLEIH